MFRWNFIIGTFLYFQFCCFLYICIISVFLTIIHTLRTVQFKSYQMPTVANKNIAERGAEQRIAPRLTPDPAPRIAKRSSDPSNRLVVRACMDGHTLMQFSRTHAVVSNVQSRVRLLPGSQNYRRYLHPMGQAWCRGFPSDYNAIFVGCPNSIEGGGIYPWKFGYFPILCYNLWTVK